jgi:uncharacterized phosphosugar-binding protein
MEKIIVDERGKIEEAAKKVAETVKNDKLFYVFGTGAHSIMSAMELFIRAGNLCNASGVFPPGLTDFDGHPKTESIMGFSKNIFSYYGIEKGDVLIICNVNGINPMTIEAALEAKKNGIYTIGVTSLEFASNVPSGVPQRHSSNKNLHDIVDLYIDAHVPVGDALVEIESLPVPVGPGSTYPMILIVNSVVLRAIELCVEDGIIPPVLKSANVAGGIKYNEKFIKIYKNRIRHFY